MAGSNHFASNHDVVQDHPFTHHRHAEPQTHLSVLVYAVISALLIHYLLLHAGYVTSSSTEVLWNLLVHTIPAHPLLALDRRLFPDGKPAGGSDLAVLFDLHRAKGQALRRIMGLPAANFTNTISRARAFSGIGHSLSFHGGTGPRGLGNWDNSCYQNSVTQGFASLPALSKYLEDNINTLGGNNLETQTALKSTIDMLNTLGDNDRTEWLPPVLKSMSSYQQQDAQEYFSKIMDEIDVEILKAKKGRRDNTGLKRPGSDDETQGDASIVSAMDGLNESDSLSESDHNYNPLEGLLAQRVGCMQCSYTEGLSLIPFNCLTVPLNNGGTQDVRDCLDEYTALEPIEGVECGKCTLLKNRQQLIAYLNRNHEEPESHNIEKGKEQEEFRSKIQKRLQIVEDAIENGDFSETTLAKKCLISPKNRQSTTKTRQAVIARPPKSLVIHINRSVFDESTGTQWKNYAPVIFPMKLDLSDWCLGTRQSSSQGDSKEVWETDPSKSMLKLYEPDTQYLVSPYELRAVITHQGRHETGHYICYRKHPKAVEIKDLDPMEEDENLAREQWWQLSDADVDMVTELDVLRQGGVFMLFYEMAEEHASQEKPPVGETDSTQAPIVPIPTISSKDLETVKGDSKLTDDIEINPKTAVPPTEDPARSDLHNTVIHVPDPSHFPSASLLPLSSKPDDGTLQESMLASLSNIDDSVPKSTTETSSHNSDDTTPITSTETSPNSTSTSFQAYQQSQSSNPQPSKGQKRVLSPVMRTSGMPDKNSASPHRKHARKASPMVTAI